jgi:hypothetical protein
VTLGGGGTRGGCPGDPQPAIAINNAAVAHDKPGSKRSRAATRGFLSHVGIMAVLLHQIGREARKRSDLSLTAATSVRREGRTDAIQ